MNQSLLLAIVPHNLFTLIKPDFEFEETDFLRGESLAEENSASQCKIERKNETNVVTEELEPSVVAA